MDINTLVPDIEQLYWDVIDGKDVVLPDETLVAFGAVVADKLAKSLRSREQRDDKKTLYMSEIGKPCHRAIWYSRNEDKLDIAPEKMLPHNKIKFLFGDIIEELMLTLAKAAGHEVEAEQQGVELDLGNGWKVRGRMDAIIDGVVVDVKSASKYSFQKFQEGLDDSNDAFGYRDQLNGYVLAAPGAVVRDAGFLVMNKETARLHFASQPYESVLPKVGRLIEDLEKPEPPARHFKLEPEGKSGNLKLGVNCSYCSYKHECWKDANDGAGLRTFIYSYGPVFLGTVNSTPRVLEITQQVKDMRKESA